MEGKGNDMCHPVTPTGEPGTRPISTVAENRWADALEQRYELLGALEKPENLLLPEAGLLMREICDALESGHVRVAEPVGEHAWGVRSWLKMALVHLGSVGDLQVQSGRLPGVEISSLGWIEERQPDRRIPAGSLLRRGCHIAPGCVVMPPSTIQVGVYLASGVRIDSHVLIGSCAQLETGVVVGSGSMVGGVLLPPTALPVVLESGVIVAGNCGVYGSVRIGQGTVLRAGTILVSGEGLYDATDGTWIVAGADGVLLVPADSEVGMGVAPPNHCPGGIQRLTAMILRRDSGS